MRSRLLALVVAPFVANLACATDGTGEQSSSTATSSGSGTSTSSATGATGTGGGASSGGGAGGAGGVTSAGGTDAASASTGTGTSCTDPKTCRSADMACIEATGPLGNGKCRGEDGTCFDCKCAAPDTPIDTPDGPRPIASLVAGDLVYSVDDGQTKVVPLLRVSRSAVRGHRVMRIALATGEVLSISGAHPTADGRRFAELRAGGQLDGVAIVAADEVPYAHPFTHDILPDSDSGAYYAGGVLIGSTLAAPDRCEGSPGR